MLLDYHMHSDFSEDCYTPMERTIEEAIQKKYAEQITIKKGIEVGLQPHVLEDTKQLIEQEYFDFVIASLHVADKKDLHNGDFFVSRSPEEAYRYFYEELLYCVKNYE